MPFQVRVYLDSDESGFKLIIEGSEPMVHGLLVEATLVRDDLASSMTRALNNWVGEELGIGKYVPFHHSSGFSTLEISLEEARASAEETARILGFLCPCCGEENCDFGCCVADDDADVPF